MAQTEICRLCLQSVPKYEEISNDSNRKIVFISDQHKIYICSCCKWYACNKCLQELDSCCSFKQTLVETEKEILNVSKHQLVSRNLKSMLNIDDPKQDTEICRFCLKVCNEHSFNLFESEMNIMPFKSIKRVCDDIFSMDLNLSDEPIMCYPCWESLQKTHTLIKVLLKTQLAINNFLRGKKIKKLKSKDLKNIKITEENVSKEQIQYSSETIETKCKVEEEGTNSIINNVKKEEISQERNKIDGKIKIEVKKEPNLTEMAINDFENIIEPSTSSCESTVEPVATSSEAITCKTEDLVVEESFVNNKIKVEIDNVDSSDCQYNTDSIDGVDTNAEGDTGNKEKLMLVNHEIITTTIVFGEETYKEIMSNTSIVDVSGQVYSCRNCDFTTPFKRGLLPHVRKHGRGPVKYDCDLCSYSTDRGIRMRNHKLTHQSQVAKVLCRHCKMPFKTINEYRVHRIRTHPEKCWKNAALYQCDLCSYSTFAKGRFEEHRIVHGDTGNREKLSCTQCDYTSFRKESLTKHLKRHPRMRVYPCYFCEKKFSRKCKLNEHALSEHGYQVLR